MKFANDLMMARTGIFCVSERFDSFPMLAHYPNNAKGFVVELKDIGISFPGDGTDVLDELRSVLYSYRRTGMTFDPASHRNIFYYKLSDWSYDKEQRVVKSLTECMTEYINGKETYMFQIDKKLVSKIIVGCNTDNNNDKKLIKHFNNNSDIVIARATVVDGKVVCV